MTAQEAFPPPADGTAFVYIAVAGTAVKIGTTDNLSRRFAQMRKAKRFEIRFYCAFRLPDRRAPSVEFSAQTCLNDWRLGSEWFCVSPAIAEQAVARAIRMICGTDSVLGREAA